MKEFLGAEVTSSDNNMYEQLAMDVSTLEYGRSIDAMDEGYQQIEMSVLDGNVNTPEMIKNQAGVVGDTIYMGSISVYPGVDNQFHHNQVPHSQMPNAQVQPYYDPNTGMMYMPMYPMYGMMPQQPVHTSQPPQELPPARAKVQLPPQPVANPQRAEVQQGQVHSSQVQPVPQMQPLPQMQNQQTQAMSTRPTQETTMYPATSVTKLVDIFGEDKKYSQALMELQAESEYKVALHANAGKNGKRYMFNLSHMNKTKQLLNWNFGAFLFGPLWYAYRKMPVKAFILVVAILYGLSTPYALLVCGGAPLLMGAFSDRIYKMRLDRIIRKQFSMPQDAKKKHMERCGGSSVTYVVMFMLFTTVIAVATVKYLLPEMEIIQTTWDGLYAFLENILNKVL